MPAPDAAQEFSAICSFTIEGVKIFLQISGAALNLTKSILRHLAAVGVKIITDEKARRILESTKTKDGATTILLPDEDLSEGVEGSLVSRLHKMGVKYSVIDDGVDNGMSYLAFPAKDKERVKQLLMARYMETGNEIYNGSPSFDFKIKDEIPDPEHNKENSVEDTVKIESVEGLPEQKSQMIKNMVKARQENPEVRRESEVNLTRKDTEKDYEKSLFGNNSKDKKRRPMKEVFAEAQREADEYNAKLGIQDVEQKLAKTHKDISDLTR